MKTDRVTILDSGTVIRQPDNVCGYNAWPSVTRNAAGELTAAFSGNRVMHVCPYGKVLLRTSRDEGKTWSAPIIAIDTPLDDRDAGVVHLGGGRLVLSTFNNTREMQAQNADRACYGSQDRVGMVKAYLPNVTDEMERKYLGSLLAVSEDDGFSWSAPFRAPVSAPHGPALLRDGSLLYAGTPWLEEDRAEADQYPIAVYRGRDPRRFEKLARIPRCKELSENFGYYEPHTAQLPGGRLVMHIRVDELGRAYEEKVFSLVQTVSDDGGRTWSEPRFLGCKGAPPHLLLHSSGTLISVYGRRTPPYGIRAMFSEDGGETWDMEHTVWGEGVDADLGYPCSVELDNGDLFTVFYAKAPGDEMTSVFWTRWRLDRAQSGVRASAAPG